MLQKMIDFAALHHLPLSCQQAGQLQAYARCVWDKKDTLNLTSVADYEEIITRHICDGLVAAAALQARLGSRPLQLADAGAGCGYIGMTLGIVLPQAQVTLLESLQRRCQFMNWAILQGQLPRVQVKQLRLGQGKMPVFDAVTERAMGKLPDILPLCMACVKPGGLFVAFQGAQPQVPAAIPAGVTYAGEIAYTLPCDKQPRFLVLFKKEYV